MTIDTLPDLRPQDPAVLRPQRPGEYWLMGPDGHMSLRTATLATVDRSHSPAEVIDPHGISLAAIHEAATQELPAQQEPDNAVDHAIVSMGQAQQDFPTEVYTAGRAGSRERLNAMGDHINNDSSAWARFEAAQAEHRQKVAAERRETRERWAGRAVSAGQIATGGVRRAISWVRSRNVRQGLSTVRAAFS